MSTEWCPNCGQRHELTTSGCPYPRVQIINPVVEVIDVHQPVLTKEEIVRQLKEYGCPVKIIEQLEQWILDYYLDTVKLEKWNREVKP